MNDIAGMYDHIDGDPFNNMRSNLRKCSSHENNYNREKSPNRKTSSKYKGVFYNPVQNRWRASLMSKGIRYDCGSYKEERDAAIAYNRMAERLHGAFAKLNTISQ